MSYLIKQICLQRTSQHL